MRILDMMHEHKHYPVKLIGIDGEIGELTSHRNLMPIPTGGQIHVRSFGNWEDARVLLRTKDKLYVHFPKPTPKDEIIIGERRRYPRFTPNEFLTQEEATIGQAIPASIHDLSLDGIGLQIKHQNDVSFFQEHLKSGPVIVPVSFWIRHQGNKRLIEGIGEIRSILNQRIGIHLEDMESESFSCYRQFLLQLHREQIKQKHHHEWNDRLLIEGAD